MGARSATAADGTGPTADGLRLAGAGRRWLIVLIAVVLVGAGAAVAVAKVRDGRCGTGQQVIATPRSPLQDAARVRDRGDARLRSLADSITGAGDPFGDLVAGLGFNYDRLLHLYGIEAGVMAWTRHNAPLTLLDGVDLTPRWALRPGADRVAWDADGDRLLLAELDDERPVGVSLHDTADATSLWCRRLDVHHAETDTVSTTFMSGGDDAAADAGPADVVVAIGDDERAWVSRLAAADGTLQWSRELTGAARADHVGMFADVLVVGGSEEHLLAEPDPDAPAGPVVAALDPATGADRWSYAAPGGAVVHVAGSTADRLVVVERTIAGTDLVALDRTGMEVWRHSTPAATYQTALRGQVLLLDAGTTLTAFAVADGAELWDYPVPADRTFLPYGFTIGQMPMLDGETLLLATTTDLRLIDLASGIDDVRALPVDGISTTYWPYQLMVTGHLIAVVTNIGGVVVERGPMVELGALAELAAQLDGSATGSDGPDGPDGPDGMDSADDPDDQGEPGDGEAGDGEPSDADDPAS